MNKEKKFNKYSKEVNRLVRKYFDDNDIEICFTLKEEALKGDFEENVSIEDSAKLFIEDLLD